VSLLAPREAYRLWAPTYEAGNALTELERGLVEKLGPSPEGRRLLDAGCGTGWRLRNAGAARAVGVDLSPEMLAQGRGNSELASVEFLEADVCALPFQDAEFDLVWCRLVIGYVPDLGQAFRELARVTRAGGAVVVTDFHPEALATGLRRTFRHGDEEHELLTYPHSVDALISAARSASLTFCRRADAHVGPQVRHFYVQAGREGFYLEHVGMPVVLGLSFVRDA